MREPSLVLPADVLRVKLVLGGDGRHRIAICTAANVRWPDVKNVEKLRKDMVSRIKGIEFSYTHMPMATRGEYHILVVVCLPAGTSERKAWWFRFEIQRVVNDQRRLAVAKNPSPHKGKSPPYVNRRVAIASAA